MDDPASIPTAALRSALHFAVGVAALRAARRPPEPYPAALRPLLRRTVLPAAALETARQVVEGDDEFRSAVAAQSSPDLVDEIGLLWLARPAGWQATIDVLVRSSGVASTTDRRRREAAEHARMRDRQQRDRAERELLVSRARVTELEAALAAAQAEVSVLAAGRQSIAEELATVRHGAERDHRRHEREVGELADRLAAIQADLESMRRQVAEAERVRDIALAGRAEGELPAMASVGPEVVRRRLPARRRPIGIPGGMLGSSERAAVHLLAHPDVTVLVDGYNVAKATWPLLDLASQRDACVAACERVARRWGTDLAVVFDGADVVGSPAAARPVVAVRFSPAGVSADDVIRRLVAELPHARHVIVVTNDRAIVDDVRRAGCNVIASEQFASVANS